jgi:hypothetical protein
MSALGGLLLAKNYRVSDTQSSGWRRDGGQDGGCAMIFTIFQVVLATASLWTLYPKGMPRICWIMWRFAAL